MSVAANLAKVPSRFLEVESVSRQLFDRVQHSADRDSLSNEASKIRMASDTRDIESRDILEQLFAAFSEFGAVEPSSAEGVENRPVGVFLVVDQQIASDEFNTEQRATRSRRNKFDKHAYPNLPAGVLPLEAEPQEYEEEKTLTLIEELMEAQRRDKNDKGVPVQHSTESQSVTAPRPTKRELTFEPLADTTLVDLSDGIRTKNQTKSWKRRLQQCVVLGLALVVYSDVSGSASLSAAFTLGILALSHMNALFRQFGAWGTRELQSVHSRLHQRRCQA